MASSKSSATPSTGEPTTTTTYRLTCTDCSFETTVEGGSYDVLEIADAHQKTYGETFKDHFVNFEIDHE
jgi:hypothetical protein